ncbi:homocysteine S-methyltransferase family protein [bacterium]|nr:homocysteine S-methyltransferase family protein [bacterium]
MNKKKFFELIKQKYLVLDGAVGTFLQKSGMPTGVCPEKWALENPDVLSGIHLSYKNAGSDIVYTCTFGANRLKLETYGLGDKVLEYNEQLAKLAKKAVGQEIYVAGAIGPMGHFIEPLGSLSFDQAYDIFSEQIKGLVAGGADLIVIETMIEIQETRAALLAAKDLCDLPVITSVTFGDDQLTLTGSDPVTTLITLQSLGADCIGTNCSTGPGDMLKVIKAMRQYANVPLMAKPNAGLPKIVNGETVFDLSAEQFSKFIPEFIDSGAALIGGCCGTSPEYIKYIKQISEGKKPKPVTYVPVRAVTSRTKTVFFSNANPPVIIGERINPTGKKKLSAELAKGSMMEVKRFAMEQKDAGADILDVNVGVPKIDELATMKTAIFHLSTFSGLPLCIDSSDPEVIAQALKIYPGRALINSLSGESDKLKRLIPSIKKYNPLFIFLPINDDGIPQTGEARIDVVKKTLTRLKQEGIPAESMVVDGITMTVSASPESPKQTLKTIDYCANKLNLLTTVGLSNVSFGLPERKNVNSAFLSMAIDRGLGSLIINPCLVTAMNIFYGASLLAGRDKNALIYINKVKKIQTIQKGSNQHSGQNNPKDLNCKQALIQGNKEALLKAVKIELDKKTKPMVIIDDFLIPAMQEVGAKFNNKELFLPQLLLSTEAMQEAFKCLKPFMEEENASKIGRMIIATVKGDIHDIGKNIVALMLRNNGIDVIDLGKDIDAEIIIKTAEKENISLIGLSALMTTTMVEMENVINIARTENKPLKFMVGGAVVTPEYAKTIGADGYSKDAVEAVEIAKKLLED